MQGGKILTGGSVIESEGNFVQPTIVEISPTADIVKEELFAPVLYVMKFQVNSSLLVQFLCWVLSREKVSNKRDLFICCYVLVLHMSLTLKYEIFVQTFEEAVKINNSVPQGLSSSIFTRSPENIFKWLG